MTTRFKKLEELGLIKEVLWEEFQYPEQEDKLGYFALERKRIETDDVKAIFDRWCRGQNLIGYAGSIMNALDGIRTACKDNTK